MTENCIINEKGEVVFFRKEERKKKEVHLNTIHDAISQNRHILKSLLADFVNVYEVNWVKPGEISQIRKINEIIQEKIQEKTYQLQPKKIDLSYLVEDLKNSRNEHKKNIYLLLSGDVDLKKLSEAQNAALERIIQLQGIIKGTLVQSERLLKIKSQSERKIKRAYKVLAQHEAWLSRTENASDEKKIQAASKAVNEIANKKANKVVYLLKSVVPVNPYKERIESGEVQKLANLHDFFDPEKGRMDLNKIIKIIRDARIKLSRIMEEERSFSFFENYNMKGGD